MKFPFQRSSIIDKIAKGLKALNDKSEDNISFFMRISLILHPIQRIRGLLRGSESDKPQNYACAPFRLSHNLMCRTTLHHIIAHKNYVSQKSRIQSPK